MPLKEVKPEAAVALGLVSDDEPQTLRKVWHFSESQWSVIAKAGQTNVAEQEVNMQEAR